MPIKRDRVFWTIAFQTSIGAFFFGGFGPAQPLLREQQHTSLAVAGLHGTALGVAAIFGGIFAPRLAHAFGREKMSWIGLLICSTGVTLFVFSPPVQLTLIEILFAGFGASTIINAMVTRLSEHYGENSSQALSQATGINSVAYIFGTLAVGTLAETGLDWRAGLLAIAPFSLILYFMNRKTANPEYTKPEEGRQSGKLHQKFWIAWVGFVACIAGEFATTFWSAALLRDRVGSTASIATICTIAFALGMALGRLFGHRLLIRVSLDHQLISMIILQFLGFSVLWFSHQLEVSLVALFATGLGIAMQFALLSIRLIEFSEERPDLAIGLSSLGAGIAIALSPFLLGLLGDHVGISRAYLMVPLLIGVTFITIFMVPTVATHATEEREKHEL